MRYRRRQGNAVSLFAFQDVMASVIGVLFFVVLLMALDIVNAGSRAVPAESRETELAELRAELQRWEAHVEAAQRRLDRISQQIELAGRGDVAIREELDRSKGRLEAMLDELSRAKKRLADSRAGTEQARREVQEQKARLEEVERSVQRARSELEQARTGANVVYIIDRKANTPEPWLVEISGDSLKTSAKDGHSAVFRFEGGTGEQRRQQFLEWADSQSVRNHYFVLLIKPSGMEEAEKLESQLSAKGFDTGMDLLPESWKAIE